MNDTTDTTSTASATPTPTTPTPTAPTDVDVFDGHNDLAWWLREERDYSVEGLNDPQFSPFTTMDQLRDGRVAAQFWSVYVHSSITGADAVVATWEQIDAVRRFVAAYPERLRFTRTAAEVAAPETPAVSPRSWASRADSRSTTPWRCSAATDVPGRAT